MLTIVYTLKGPLTFIQRHTTYWEYQKIALTTADWFIVKNLIMIFTVFVKPSTQLQGELYITLPSALIHIYKVYKELQVLQRYFIKEANQNPSSVSYICPILITIYTNMFLGLLF